MRGYEEKQSSSKASALKIPVWKSNGGLQCTDLIPAYSQSSTPQSMIYATSLPVQGWPGKKFQDENLYDRVQRELPEQEASRGAASCVAQNVIARTGKPSLDWKVQICC